MFIFVSSWALGLKMGILVLNQMKLLKPSMQIDYQSLGRRGQFILHFLLEKYPEEVQLVLSKHIQYQQLYKLFEVPRPVEVVQLFSRPGVECDFGFLGANESLVQLIDSDADVLKQYGVTVEQVANALERVTKNSTIKNKDGITYLIDGKYWITAGGGGRTDFPNCPWGCTCKTPWGNMPVSGRVDYLVKKFDTNGKGFIKKHTDPNIKLVDQVIFSNLVIHLIREHGFFEGKDLPVTRHTDLYEKFSYRVEPLHATKMFELAT